jgi:hypothetical protein
VERSNYELLTGLWMDAIQYIFVLDCDEFHIVQAGNFVYSFLKRIGSVSREAVSITLGQ